MRTDPRRISRVFPLVLVACVGCDQASKQAAGLLLAGGHPLSLFGDTVRFELASNPGAFLSLGAGLAEPVRHALLLGLVPALLALVCGACLVGRTPLSRSGLVALGLIAGGGLGNWLDRVLHDGSVTDFVSLGLGRFRTGIFNVADLAVLAGVFLMMRLARGREPAGPW